MTFARPLPSGAEMAVPLPARLAMPDQRFDRPFRDPSAPGMARQQGTGIARVFVLGLPLAVALAVTAMAGLWLAKGGGLTAVEAALAVGTGIACFWMAVSVATAVLGLIRRPAPRPPALRRGLRVAILLPMYGEDAEATIGAGVALLAAMPGRDHAHRFSLHILSDTRDPALRAAELSVLAGWQGLHPHLPLSLRQRRENTDFKSGNIREWISAQGAAFDAALILDADSVMGRGAVLALVNALAADPGLGLVQSHPLVLPGTTLWQRLQSFASHAYGANLGRGVAAWAGAEGNFLGHNAVIRLTAFAAAAGLPHLPGPRPMGGVILSHDFVEAALLRRAGWGVRMLPEAAGSHEGTPETLPGYLRRDRRWCQGNMQHLRLLAMPGLHWMSRFHLLQGAVGYLASVGWLVLLVLWVVLAQGSADGGAALAGPVAGPFALTLVVGGLLMAPKALGLAAHLRRNPPPRGRRGAFAATLLAELAVSALLAPAMMLHQVLAVVSTLCGIDRGWSPHLAGRPTFARLARFHAIEIGVGTVLCWLGAGGVLTPWVLPVGVCLVLTLPLSWLVAQDVSGWRLFAAPAPR